MFTNVQPIAEELHQQQNREFIYFGKHHLSVETGHTTGIENVDNFLKNLIISEKMKESSLEIIDDLFSAFTDFTHELLNLSLQMNDCENSISSLYRNDFDYLILGAGPAGIQLGYYLEKSNHDYVILESGKSPGTFFKDYPRHRKLISINKRHTGYDNPEINLRWDWNSLLSDSEEMLFKHYSKKIFPKC
ncbi:NAD(P)-binding domain-containing protein [Acaryochloris sp. 'Moss Beach']|uniref:NAD(P)-binding domain-containing protein n=1 Tax=Acaryochloris sp. 'Moss Beach' TaxID=2740837 RepID=UPI001F2B26B3|nr:NAD(P)-binding domain-containing protein [Acaryochloris sp. 'Moss Beach']